MEKVFQALQYEAIRGKVKIIIGRAPVGVDFAHKMGADAHGKDAAEAVTLYDFVLKCLAYESLRLVQNPGKKWFFLMEETP